MSSNRFVFNGLEELKAQLRTLPADLAGEASHIVDGWANSAAVDIKAAYGGHVVSGNLRDGVHVTRFAKGRFGVGVQVVSASKHAWLFDNGSQARHHVSGKSTGTMWGQTPPTHVFVATMRKKRRQMYEDLGDLMRRHGLVVSGVAA